MKKRFAIGVDVGGSHVSCMTYDLKDNKLVEGTAQCLPIDNKGSKEKVIGSLTNLIKPAIQNIDQDEFAGIGMAFPGPIDYENGIGLFSGENAKFVNLCQVNIQEELAEKLKIEPDAIRFINDAAAFALGEYIKGNINGFKQCLAITLGTGFGAAFLSKGIPVLSDKSVPKGGCLWHLPFEDGIADEYFSTRGIVERYNLVSEKTAYGVKEVADLYTIDKDAQKVFEDFGQKLAVFLTPWIKSFEVDALVIGGNISKAFNLFIQPMRTAIENEGLSIKIGASELREDAAFIGAGHLHDDEFFEKIKEQLKLM